MPPPTSNIYATDSTLTSMIRRLEAATSRLEDIASVSIPNGAGDAPIQSVGGTVGGGPTAGGSTGTPTAPVESAPPVIEAFDQLVNTELKNWLELSAIMGDVIGGQSKAVEQAFAAERQFLVIANKAKKPDDRNFMEFLKELQASIEKTDEFKQTNREEALKDPLSLVADGVGSLGWVSIPEGAATTPHDYIKELFGGAQMYGNKVLKEYRDKYVPLVVLPCLYWLTTPGPRIRFSFSGYRHTTFSSKLLASTPKSTTPAV